MRDVVAWAAGFIDGEGCIDLKRNTLSCTPRVRATQTDIRPLRRLQRYWGGKIYRVTSDHKDAWEWYLSGDQAFAFLERIVRSLTNKQDEARLLIENRALWPCETDYHFMLQCRVKDHLQAMKRG